MAFKPEDHFMKMKGNDYLPVEGENPREDRRRRPHSAEHRARIATALRGVAKTDEHRAKLAASLLRKGTNWKAYRRIAFGAHGSACQRCSSTRHVNVHHRDGNHANYAVDNLEVLCRSCHNREHGLGGDVRNVTHCPQGHAYTPENTYLYHAKDGATRRVCRECGRAKNRRWYARQKGRQDNDV